MKPAKKATWLLWGIIIVVWILACLFGCQDISQMDLNVSGTGNADTGAMGATIGARFYFDHTPRRLPNYSKDK